MRLDAMILKIISVREMYGYEIVSELKNISDNYFKLNSDWRIDNMKKNIDEIYYKCLSISQT